ncbi:MAG: ABC transporter permease, partial [Streptomyces albidoflavus]
MASTETRDAAEEAAREPKKPSEDLAGLEAGLDALDAVPTRRTSLRDTFVRKVLPPLVAVALVLVVWQVLVWAQVTEEYKLPSPGAVWAEV